MEQPLTLTLMLTALAAAVQPVGAQQETQRSNIVFLLADDQAWNETSLQMHPDVPISKSDFHQTPWLVRFARQGMRFSAAYAPAPKCAQSLHLANGKEPRTESSNLRLQVSYSNRW